MTAAALVWRLRASVLLTAMEERFGAVGERLMLCVTPTTESAGRGCIRIYTSIYLRKFMQVPAAMPQAVPCGCCSSVLRWPVRASARECGSVACGAYAHALSVKNVTTNYFCIFHAPLTARADASGAGQVGAERSNKQRCALLLLTALGCVPPLDSHHRLLAFALHAHVMHSPLSAAGYEHSLRRAARRFLGSSAARLCSVLSTLRYFARCCCYCLGYGVDVWLF